MKIEITAHVHLHGTPDDYHRLLERVEHQQGSLATLARTVANLASATDSLKGLTMTGFARLEKALEDQKTVVGGIELLTARMAAEIRELFPDNAKADALATKFEENSRRIAAAIVVGTAAADESDANQAGSGTDPNPNPEPAPAPGGDPNPTPDPEPEP